MNKHRIINHLVKAKGLKAGDPNLKDFMDKLEVLWNSKGPKAQRLAFKDALNFGKQHGFVDDEQDLIDLPFDED